MTENDFAAFAAMWTQASRIYDKQVDSNLVNFVFKVLKRFELADVEKALARHLNDPDSGRFMPRPADIVRQLEGRSDQKAWAAWSKLDQAIRCIGQYQSVVFDDPIIMRVIQDMGGWIHLCEIPNEKNLNIKAHEFKTRYERYAQSPPSVFPSRLIGLEEGDRRQREEARNPPVLIGDADKCIAVSQRGVLSTPTIHRFNSLKSLEVNHENQRA